MGPLKTTHITLQMADRSVQRPVGLLEDVSVRVGNNFIPVDFVVLDIAEDAHIPIILGRPFLNTAGAVIDVGNGKLTLNIGDDKVTFNLAKTFRSPMVQETSYCIEIVDESIESTGDLPLSLDSFDVLGCHVSCAGTLGQDEYCCQDTKPIGLGVGLQTCMPGKVLPGNIMPCEDSGVLDLVTGQNADTVDIFVLEFTEHPVDAKCCRRCGSFEHPTPECEHTLSDIEDLHDTDDERCEMCGSYESCTWNCECTEAEADAYHIHRHKFGPPPLIHLEKNEFWTQYALQAKNNDELAAEHHGDQTDRSSDQPCRFELPDYYPATPRGSSLFSDWSDDDPEFDAESLHSPNSHLSRRDSLKRFLEGTAGSCTMNPITKLGDPGRFTIPIEIGNHTMHNALVDLGSAVSAITPQMAINAGLTHFEDTELHFRMADMTTAKPIGLLTDLPVRVGPIYVNEDFYVLDTHKDSPTPIILGRPFLNTTGACFDVRTKTLTLELGDTRVVVSQLGAPKTPKPIVPPGKHKVRMRAPTTIRLEYIEEMSKPVKRRLSEAERMARTHRRDWPGQFGVEANGTFTIYPSRNPNDRVAIPIGYFQHQDILGDNHLVGEHGPPPI